METYTIREVAELTGRSVKAIRNRCDRGELRFVIQEFDGGPGQIALHGRHGALLGDPLGTARSHGCVRFDNDVIRVLAGRLPNGTPIEVR